MEPDVSAFLALQRAAGNAAVLHLLGAGPGAVAADSDEKPPAIQRSVEIFFNEEEPTMESKIARVVARRDGNWQVALEDQGASDYQNSHVTADVVFRAMIERLLVHKTYAEAWQALIGQYEFLGRLWQAWREYPGWGGQGSSSAKAPDQLETDFKLAQIAWQGVLPHIHEPQGTTTKLVDGQIRGLASQSDKWVATRMLFPYSSLRPPQHPSSRQEDYAGNEVLEGIKTRDQQAALEGIFRAFDFQVDETKGNVTLQHALALAARHLIEHVRYYPGLAQWGDGLYRGFFRLWWNLELSQMLRFLVPEGLQALDFLGGASSTTTVSATVPSSSAVAHTAVAGGAGRLEEAEEEEPKGPLEQEKPAVAPVEAAMSESARRWQEQRRAAALRNRLRREASNVERGGIEARDPLGGASSTTTVSAAMPSSSPVAHTAVAGGAGRLEEAEEEEPKGPLEQEKPALRNRLKRKAPEAEGGDADRPERQRQPKKAYGRVKRFRADPGAEEPEARYPDLEARGQQPSAQGQNRRKRRRGDPESGDAEKQPAQAASQRSSKRRRRNPKKGGASGRRKKGYGPKVRRFRLNPAAEVPGEGYSELEAAFLVACQHFAKIALEEGTGASSSTGEKS